MKPKNFPARKLARRIAAGARSRATQLTYADEQKQLAAARDVRTKKRRAS